MNEEVYKEGMGGVSAIITLILLIILSLFKKLPNIYISVGLLILFFIITLILKKLNKCIGLQMISNIIFKICLYIVVVIMISNFLFFAFNLSVLISQVVLGVLILFFK